MYSQFPTLSAGVAIGGKIGVAPKRVTRLKPPISIQTYLSRLPTQAADLLVGEKRRLQPLPYLLPSCEISLACWTCNPIASATAAIRALNDHKDQGGGSHMS